MSVASFLIRTLYSSWSPPCRLPSGFNGISIVSLRKPDGYSRASGTSLGDVERHLARRPQPVEAGELTEPERIDIELGRQDGAEDDRACCDQRARGDREHAARGERLRDLALGRHQALAPTK